MFCLQEEEIVFVADKLSEVGAGPDLAEAFRLAVETVQRILRERSRRACEAIKKEAAKEFTMRKKAGEKGLNGISLTRAGHYSVHFRVGVSGSLINIGTFATVQEAAHALDVAWMTRPPYASPYEDPHTSPYVPIRLLRVRHMDSCAEAVAVAEAKCRAEAECRAINRRAAEAKEAKAEAEAEAKFAETLKVAKRPFNLI